MNHSSHITNQDKVFRISNHTSNLSHVSRNYPSLISTCRSSSSACKSHWTIESVDIHTLLWVRRCNVSCEMTSTCEVWIGTFWESAFEGSCVRFEVFIQFVSLREYFGALFTYESLWGFRPLTRNLCRVIRRCWTSFVAVSRWLKWISVLRIRYGRIRERRRFKEVVIP